MGQTTKIDWADSSWNPVTGCRHDCEYCYARGIAQRFGGYTPITKEQAEFKRFVEQTGPHTGYVIGEKPLKRIGKDGKERIAPYPHYFAPTLYEYKLDEPKHWEKPRTIFVCSMADLFGAWVPDEWIKAVFDACEAAPQHRYLFLSKNPARYIELARKDMLPRQHWYGYSATRQSQLWSFHHADECPCINLFVSIEPILEPMQPNFSTHTPADWVIIGAETGNRRGRVKPEKPWIDNILMECEYSGRPVFMKENLREIMGDDFRQEFPWEV